MPDAISVRLADERDLDQLVGLLGDCVREMQRRGRARAHHQDAPATPKSGERSSSTRKPSSNSKARSGYSTASVVAPAPVACAPEDPATMHPPDA